MVVIFSFRMGPLFHVTDSYVCLCYCNAGRGSCDCGRCKCTGNWTGPSCSCSSDTSECVKNGVRMNERTHARTHTCTHFQIYRYVYTDPSKHTKKLKASNISLSVYRGNTCGQYLVVLILFGLLSNLHKNRSGCFNTRFWVRLPSLD